MIKLIYSVLTTRNGWKKLNRADTTICHFELFNPRSTLCLTTPNNSQQYYRGNQLVVSIHVNGKHMRIFVGDNAKQQPNGFAPRRNIGETNITARQSEKSSMFSFFLTVSVSYSCVRITFTTFEYTAFIPLCGGGGTYVLLVRWGSCMCALLFCMHTCTHTYTQVNEPLISE